MDILQDVQITKKIYTFSGVKKKNSKKSLIFIKKGPPAICHGRELPLPVKGLPCDLTCDLGEYFNTTSIKCENCTSGTMSTPDVDYQKWEEWPGPFKRICNARYPDKPCQEWQLKGSYIDSGVNSDDTETALTYTIEV